jgi:hypothetical protein
MVGRENVADPAKLRATKAISQALPLVLTENSRIKIVAIPSALLSQKRASLTNCMGHFLVTSVNERSSDA